MTTLKTKDITNLLAWLVASPVLGFWPIISFLPLFQIFARGNTVGDILVQGAFAATSALGVIGFAVLFQFVVKPEAKQAMRDARKGLALKLALYAALWSTSYIVYSLF